MTIVRAPGNDGGEEPGGRIIRASGVFSSDRAVVIDDGIVTDLQAWENFRPRLRLPQLSQLEQAGGEVWVREGGKHESVQ